jgi:hypothetical protein
MQVIEPGHAKESRQRTQSKLHSTFEPTGVNTLDSLLVAL